jgi:formylglycine-generating enzyme required for sulfatase activity
MGSHPALDALATPYEQPQHELLLPGYWISRYPVTTAKFYAFVNESGYQPQGNGWRHGPMNHPVTVDRRVGGGSEGWAMTGDGHATGHST